MKHIFNFFVKESQLDIVLRKQTVLEPRLSPKELIQQLKKGQLAKLITIVNQQETVPLLALRKLTLVHYVLLHYPQFYEDFHAINLKVKTSDEWLNLNIITPYTNFLYKIINSNGMYEECKRVGTHDYSFRKLFYIVNTLKDLFPCVKKMSNLSRYYSVVQKKMKTHISTDYVFSHAFQAQQLYNSFKAILTEMITNPDIYLRSEPDQQMIRYILEEVVVKLNEDMKNLFLDKYFFPYGKGYSVKLFREDELFGQARQFVDYLYCKSSEKQMRKMKKKMTLDRFLFDQSGHLNPQIYHTLSQIRQGDESFRDASFRSAAAPRRLKTLGDIDLTQDV